jgi:hypothetical protein
MRNGGEWDEEEFCTHADDSGNAGFEELRRADGANDRVEMRIVRFSGK